MKYIELSDSAKEKVHQWYCGTLDNDWYESVFEQAKDEGVALGFYIDEIYFTGFWSQGDGASWKGEVDVAKWCSLQDREDSRYAVLRVLIEEGYVDCRLYISTSGRYSHSYTMYVTHGLGGIDSEEDAVVMATSEPIFSGMTVSQLASILGGDEGVGDIETEMLASAREYADDIYNQLEQEYSYITSEECIAELAAVNDWDFDETGEMI